MMTDKELIQKYPFLEIKNKRACPGMTGTWLSDLPEGWKEKLLEMCDEIMGIAHNYMEVFGTYIETEYVRCPECNDNITIKEIYA